MRSTAVVILQTLVAQALATDPSSNAEDSVDRLIDTLIGRALRTSIDDKDLDKSTLAKTSPSALGSAAPLNLYQTALSRGATSALAAPRSALPVGVSPPQVSRPQANRPQVSVDAMRSSQMHSAPAALSASPLSRSRPRVGDMISSVSTMQDTLRSYGMPSSPLEKLALTAIAATRDVSMAAQVRQEFANLDAKSQATVRAAEEAVETEEVKLKIQDLAGITAPMGLFDPLGFTTDLPSGSLLFYREAELKHGRVGMLASAGILVGESFHPLFGGFIDEPAYKAFQATPLQTFWPLVLLVIGAIETTSILTFEQPFDRFSGYAIKKGWQVQGGRIPGDLGWDPLGLKPKDPKGFQEMQNKELNNGRLAMLAAAGMLAQELVNGQKIR